MGVRVNTRLALSFVTGFTHEGEEIVRVRQFQNINPAAENSGLSKTAEALASLQQHELVKVERGNTYELTGE
ncbi:DUF1659 domain-containing protein [Alteribacter keqinensis]|uniref:DUF1659 domain-containing protein n=1 Tax=Alteribacter keqinensis TaxID=2483800 RepID=A0A3M7TXU6_9BACI|nr:DUF1659 domain-containing protein [Alteribacter keqinensis]RNA70111.1 DUF1659 domain-containing protein [Alteribacter keqinensis]